MSPIHDVDVLLLLAVSLAAKRRPAEPVDIIAAIDLIQKNVPNEEKLSDAFLRLGSAGLMCASGTGIILCEPAKAMIEQLPRKADTAERLFSLRDALSVWTPVAEGSAAPIALPAIELRAALQAYRASEAGSAKNLLMPKVATSEPAARPGQRKRKPMAARRRRD